VTAWERLNRFGVAHGPCAGEVEFNEFTEADLVVEGEELVGVWVSVRCCGCGVSTRELASGREMFANFRHLVAAAGVDIQEIQTAIEEGDEAKQAELAERVMQSPAMLRVALDGIRQAQAGRSQN
jgi:hypothetical protein